MAESLGQCVDEASGNKTAVDGARGWRDEKATMALVAKMLLIAISKFLTQIKTPGQCGPNLQIVALPEVSRLEQVGDMAG